MAEYIPNQPVYFGDPIECNTDELEYVQIVDNGDSTQFQFKIDKCEEATSVITNGTFDSNITGWTVDSGWIWSSGTISKPSGSGTGWSAIFQNSLVRDKYYVCEIVVQKLTGGKLTVYFSENAVGEIFSPGTYRFFGYCINAFPTANYLAVIADTDNVATDIDKIEAYEIKRDFVVAIYNKNGDFIDEITYSQNPSQFIFYKDTVTISIFWQDHNAENDCYYLCLLDPCRNTNGQNYPAKILNCSFGSDTEWSHSGWSYSSGYIETTLDAAEFHAASQSSVFSSLDTDYYIEIDVEITGTAQLVVKFGTNTIQTITSTGVYSLIGKPLTNFNIYLEASCLTGSGIVRVNSVCNSKSINGNADIINGSFDNDFGEWDSEWTIYNPSPGDKRAIATVDSTTTTKDLIQRDVFDSLNKEYGIRVTVLMPPSERAEIDVYFGTNLVQTLVFESPVGSHTYDIYGYPSGNLDLTFTARYVSSSGDTVTIYDVSPIVRESEYECDFTSNLFKLNDYSQNCTLLINACNDEDGLGFVFGGSQFSPRVRINGKLKQAKYNSVKETYDDSAGDRKNVYYRRRKSKLLATELEPEYIHDFLSTLVGYDKFYVNGQVYVCDDSEYSIEYGDGLDNMGSVTLQISEKVQLVTNVNYTDTVNNCNIGESLLLQSDDPSSLVTQADGSGIKING